jgi:hypothetical protein
VHKTGSDITMFTANWDSIWQRPCGMENEEKCKPTLLHGRVSAAICCEYPLSDWRRLLSAVHSVSRDHQWPASGGRA